MDLCPASARTWLSTCGGSCVGWRGCGTQQLVGCVHANIENQSVFGMQVQDNFERQFSFAAPSFIPILRIILFSIENDAMNSRSRNESVESQPGANLLRGGESGKEEPGWGPGPGMTPFCFAWCYVPGIWCRRGFGSRLFWRFQGECRGKNSTTPPPDLDAFSPKLRNESSLERTLKMCFTILSVFVWNGHNELAHV